MGVVLVTGATGNVGRAVFTALQGRGVPAVAASRRPTQPGERRLDFRAAESWPGALRGVRSLFLVRPPAISDVAQTLLPFIDAARASGVSHVVFLSVAGAERNRWVPHRAVEDHLIASGPAHTLLRPGFFAQNLQSAYRADIVEDDRIYVPAGRHPVNWIDVRDIAEVAALILAAPEAHRGQGYTLTGPGPVAWSAVTETLSEVLGRPIRYEPASVPGYFRHLSRRGLPRDAIAVQTILHVLLRFGQGATEDPTLARLLGHPGRSIHTYIRDHSALWQRDTTTP